MLQYVMYAIDIPNTKNNETQHYLALSKFKLNFQTVLFEIRCLLFEKKNYLPYLHYDLNVILPVVCN